MGTGLGVPGCQIILPRKKLDILAGERGCGEEEKECTHEISKILNGGPTVTFFSFILTLYDKQKQKSKQNPQPESHLCPGNPKGH